MVGLEDSAHPTCYVGQRVAGGGPTPTGGRYDGRDVSTGIDLAGQPERGDLAGRVAQRVEHLELRDVVLGHRGEILVEGHLQQLESVDDFLRPIDQLQDVAETLRLPQPFQAPVECDEARPQRAFRLRHPGRRRLKIRLGLRDFRGHIVLHSEQIGDGARLLAALLA